MHNWTTDYGQQTTVYRHKNKASSIEDALFIFTPQVQGSEFRVLSSFYNCQLIDEIMSLTDFLDAP